MPGRRNKWALKPSSQSTELGAHRVAPYREVIFKFFPKVLHAWAVHEGPFSITLYGRVTMKDIPRHNLPCPRSMNLYQTGDRKEVNNKSKKVWPIWPHWMSQTSIDTQRQNPMPAESPTAGLLPTTLRS